MPKAEPATLRQQRSLRILSDAPRGVSAGSIYLGFSAWTLCLLAMFQLDVRQPAIQR